MEVRQVSKMSDDNNTTENIVHLTTPEFMYLLQKVDRLDEKFTGRIDNLSNRIDNLDEKFTSRINGLDEKFTGRIDKLSNRIDNLDEKFTNKIDALRQEVKQDTSSIKTLIWATFGLMVGTIAIALTVAASLVR